MHIRALASLFLLTLSPLPAQAWQAGTDGPLCTLTHAQADGDALLTFDPTGPVYTLTLTRPAGWEEAPEFSIFFEGPRPLVIATDAHVLTAGDTALGVTDRGFGNVLDGLQYNRTAIAWAGETTLVLDLTGAAPEVAAFRDCLSSPSV